MKRCPECRRDYYDDTLSYCLADGTELLYGLADGEPATAVLSESPEAGVALSRAADASESKTAVIQPPATTGVSDSSRGLKLRVGLGAFALIVVVFGGFLGYQYLAGTSGKQIDSIAVMPFVNDSGNAEIDYLSDGMTETLISSLSKIANVSVKARSAVFSYKGKNITARQIGDELGVQAVLLGRLVERGGYIKLSLELVNARTLDVIWSEVYDRKQSELINLQTEIAHAVSGKLKGKLSGNDEQKLAKVYTSDPETYRLYLQARFCLNKRVGKEYDKAGGYLQQALARDPNFALGYVGLAEFYDDDDRPRAKENILRALSIDNELSEAHAAYGYQLILDRDWPAAEREFAWAIELDPRNVRAHQWNATRLMFIGRHQECLAAYDRAIELEPTFADIRVNRATCIAVAGRMDEGIAEIRKATEIDPSYPWAYSALSFLYRMKGDHEASVEARARSAELAERPDLAKRLRDTFRERGWKAYLQELFDQTSGLFPNLVRRASILCELGKPDEAMVTLEQSAARGDWWLFIVKHDPQFDILRGDPRFQAVVKQFDPPQ